MEDTKAPNYGKIIGYIGLAIIAGIVGYIINNLGLMLYGVLAIVIFVPLLVLSRWKHRFGKYQETVGMILMGIAIRVGVGSVFYFLTGEVKFALGFGGLLIAMLAVMAILIHGNFSSEIILGVVMGMIWASVIFFMDSSRTVALVVGAIMLVAYILALGLYRWTRDNPAREAKVEKVDRVLKVVELLLKLFGK
jgi:hypothetical protein